MALKRCPTCNGSGKRRVRVQIPMVFGPPKHRDAEESCSPCGGGGWVAASDKK